MTPTENELRETLAGHVREVPGDGDRLRQVHARIHRARRRRQAVASGVLVVVAAGVAVGLTVPGSGRHASVVPSQPQPTAAYGTAVLAGPGPVLLDAATGRISTGHGGTALGLSYDGRYVASSLDHGTRVEVTDRDGHVLLSDPTGTQAATWSPTADLLAVVGTASTSTLTLYDISPSGADVVARTVVGGADPTPAVVWSPDGTRLAVGSGHDLTFFAMDLKIAVPTSFGDGYPEPAAWSGDGSHLVVFVHSGSASIDADGVQVVDVDASGRRVGTLPESLAYPDWWHSLPGTDVLGTVGPVRTVQDGKTVVRCDLATAHCTTLAGDAKTSAFGAVPTATGIAYLAATNTTSLGAYPTSRLMLAAADGSAAHAAPGAPGNVGQVVAGTDGRTLLLAAEGPETYVIYRYDGHAATHLADVPGTETTGYYGHVTEIVDWRQPANTHGTS